MLLWLLYGTRHHKLLWKSLRQDPGPAAPFPSLPISFSPSLSLSFSGDPPLPGLQAMSFFPACQDGGLVSSRLRVPSRGFSLPNPGSRRPLGSGPSPMQNPLWSRAVWVGDSLCRFWAGQGEYSTRPLCVWELTACLVGTGILQELEMCP